MQSKTFTQFGTLSVAVMLPLFLIFTGLLIRSGLTGSPDIYIHSILSFTFLICLLIFYKLTITLNNSIISFKMGIGLVSKTYELSDISFCKPVTNSFLIGIGIRMLPNGWLYNVTGRKAVELHFRNRRSIVRIGTDRPEEICELIRSLVPLETAGEEKTKRWVNPLWIGVILLVAALVIIPNYIEARVRIGSSGIRIGGIYGVTIPYQEIELIDTLAKMPHIASRTNGYAFDKTLTGHFRMADKSSARLFIKRGSAPYILIRSANREPVYINFKDSQKTISLYQNAKSWEHQNK